MHFIRREVISVASFLLYVSFIFLKGGHTNQATVQDVNWSVLIAGRIIYLKIGPVSLSSYLYFFTGEQWLLWKDPDAGEDWVQEEKGMTEDEMVGWHHWLNGHEFGETPGVGDGQRGLACCGSWGCKESDTSKWLNWTEWTFLSIKESWRYNWILTGEEDGFASLCG